MRLSVIILPLILIGCEPNYNDIVSPESDAYTIEADTVINDMYSNNELKYITIHCTASRGNNTPEWFENLWKSQGWNNVGYSYLVLKNGTIHIWKYHNFDALIEPFELTYGVKGRNKNSVHIAYEGGVDARLQPKDTRTEKQKKSIKWLVQRHLEFAPNADVVGHRDIQIYTNKACPSFDVKSEYGCLSNHNDDRISLRKQGSTD